MAISFIAKTNANFTLTGTEPAGTASGDELIAIVFSSASATVHTGPAGWTKIIDIYSLAGISAWRIDRGGSAPALTWAGPAAVQSEVAIFTYRGTGSGASAIDGTPTSSSNSTTTSPTTPSVTTLLANSWLLGALGVNGTSGASTKPASMTSRQDIATASNIRIGEADEAVPSPGATGTRTWTFATTSVSLALSFALAEPAAAGMPFTLVDDYRLASPPQQRRDTSFVGLSMTMAAPAIPGNFQPVYARNNVAPLQRPDSPTVNLTAGLLSFVGSGGATTTAGAPAKLLKQPPAPATLGTPVNLLTAPAIRPAGIQVFERNAKAPRPTPSETWMGTQETILSFYDAEGGSIWGARPANAPRFRAEGVTFFDLALSTPLPLAPPAAGLDRLARAVKATPSETWMGTPETVMAQPAMVPQAVYQRANVYVKQSGMWLQTRAIILAAPAVVPAGKQFSERRTRGREQGASYFIQLAPYIFIFVSDGLVMGGVPHLYRSIGKLELYSPDSPRHYDSSYGLPRYSSDAPRLYTKQSDEIKRYEG